MAKKKTHEEFIRELNGINPSILPLQRYSGTHTRMEVRCKKCGYVWSPEPKTLLQGIGCPACSGRVPIKGKNDFATIHPELLVDWDYDTNDANSIKPDQFTERSGKKVAWKCHVCGESWSATIDKRVAGRGCPACSIEKQKTSRINGLIEKYGSLASENKELLLDWDYEENGKRGLFPDKRTTQSNQVAHWKCHVCSYEWDAIIANRVKGSGCPVCANKIIIEGVNDLGTTNPDLIDDWDVEKNIVEGKKYTEISSGSEYKAHWKCRYCGHEWRAYVYSRAAGFGCPECAKRWQSSVPEMTLLYYVQKMFPEAVNRYQPEWIKPSEIDIFVPELSLGIEYDGQAWHNSIEKDLEKDEKCKRNGVALLRVREPLCPQLKDRELTYVRSSKALNTMDQMVVDVFTLIECKYSIKLNKDICFEKDKESIFEKLGYHKLENNIAQIPNKADCWDYELNGFLRPEFFSPNSEIEVYWRCDNCGYSWKSSIKEFVNNKSDCPVCSGRLFVEGKNDFATECPELLEDWDYEKNDRDGVYPNKIRKTYREKVHWKCKKCGYEWMTKPYNRYYGKTGCPNCWDKRRKGK